MRLAALLLGVANGLAPPTTTTTTTTAPFTFSTSRAEAIAGLPAWLTKHGGEASRVEIAETPIGWGFVARQDIAKGERILTLPRALCLAAGDGPEWLAISSAASSHGRHGRHSRHSSDHSSDHHSSSGGPDSPDDDDDPPPTVEAGTAVAAFVLDELERGEASTWAPYLASVPRPDELLADLPTLWPEADAAGLLAGTKAGASRASLLRLWRRELASLNDRRARAVSQSVSQSVSKSVSQVSQSVSRFFVIALAVLV
jgi:hypothetical protein